ncbi:hypothetical protein NQZ68_000455 [Dissostichus eleginoides]|nr:hypothetical protein NQZ68_000455 [Dissostichus eleginoides]
MTRGSETECKPVVSDRSHGIHSHDQRTCHELEQKPISAALQSHMLPIPPEVTVAPGELCYWLQ